jgi:poly-beta-1,6-N-acetyl-D-glucosamine biosynthesis protein PgaD
MPEIKIIDNPSLKGFFRNMGEWSFTVLMWGVWVYFFLPIINIILWLFGIRHFYIELVEKGGYYEFLNLIERIGWLILIVFAILRLWGWYNYKKFGQLNRRKFPLATTTEKLSEYFKIPIKTIQELQGQKEVIIDTESDLFKVYQE